MFLQDLWLAVGLIGLAAVALFVNRSRSRPIMLDRRQVLALAVAVVAATYAGRYLVLEGFDLVRDEQMVTFDAWIFRHGRLVWPLPAFWRDHAAALNTVFMYPAQHPVAWVSSYLPGNAMLHAAIGAVTDQALTNPLLAGGSVWLVWSCARKLWPDDREAATVSLIVLVLSGQFLVATMTTWAMTAHLFFNLLWLRLFLADRRATDGAAVLVGIFATGLHQPLFHPLFVAPFLLGLFTQRRWARLLPLAAAYAAIGLFWLAWPHWIEAMVAGPPVGGGAAAPAASGFVDRLRGALSENTDNLTLTAANLLRFITWNHLALAPLVFAAWPAIRRDPVPMALAAGLILPVVVMAALLPWQGYGFGYRYLHPVLGNAALLAGFGWRNLAGLHERLRAPLLVTSLGMAVAILPAQLLMSHRFVDASASGSRKLDASRADYAVIRTKDGLGYANLVFNMPDLSNRPIRLGVDRIPDHAGLAARICRAGVTVAMPGNAFFRPGTLYYGVKPFDTADATIARLRGFYERAGCRIVEVN